MLIPVLMLLLIDLYIFQAVKTSFADSKPGTQRTAYTAYWLLSSVTYIALLILFLRGYTNWHGWSKIILVGMAQSIFVAKLFVLPFLIVDELLRAGRWLFGFFVYASKEAGPAAGISRLQFLSRLGLLIGSISFGGFLYGIFRGGYEYRKRKVSLPLRDLPAEWENLKIVQVSDLHLGSFADSNPVREIVRLINEEDADIVFFTGDLVNYAAAEAEPHIEVLKTLRAKEGIFSILGNHDYGMYMAWDSPQQMHDNFSRLLQIQREELGWDLLMDEHRILERNGKQLAIIGVQYIGHTLRFGKMGNLKKAYDGAENASIQLLLSHDPSHWDKEVSLDERYRGIQHTFSGHTHGFQFGIEIPSLGLKWSPAKYVYPHWAGLYRFREQHLYVNRGAGFLGYPGRLGISPEITIFQFEKA